MIIVQGYFRVDPATRADYLEQSIEQMLTSRAEQGCQEYTLAADPVEADRVILSERWDTAADLDEHARALVARRAEAEATGNAPALAPLSREIARYEVASAQDM